MSRYEIVLFFLQRLSEDMVFAHFGVEKNVFSQQKHIRLQATGKWNLHTKYQVSTTKTVADGHTDTQTTRTNRSMKTERTLLVTSPCLASF